MATEFGVKFLIGASLGASVASAFSGLQDRLRATQQSFRRTQAESRAMDNVLALRTRRDAVVEQARGQMRQTGAIDANLRREIAELNAQYANVARSAGVYGRTLDEITQRQRQLASAAQITEERLRRMSAIQNERDRRSAMLGQVRGLIAPAASVAMPVKLAIDFESAMADVKKVTDFDAPGMEKFSQGILDLSTRLPMAANGLAAIASAAGQAGIAKEELLTFTEDAAKMGVAFDISAADAGSAMTGLRTNFKLTQDEVRLLGDAMNALSNSMDAKASEIVDFANRAGGTASVYGFTGQEVAALGAAFRACKVGVEEASTATNTMLVNLGTASKLPKAAQAGFKSLGVSAKGLEKAFKKDAQGALLSFLRTVKKSKDPMSALTDIFGKDHAPKIVRLMNNLELYEQALNKVSKKENYANSTQDEYAARAETTANNIQLLKNTVNRLGITMGSVLLPPLNAFLKNVSPLVSTVADFAKENEGLTAGLAMGAAGFVGLRVGAVVFRYLASVGRTSMLQIGGAFTGARRALSIPWPFAPIRNGLQSIGRNAASAVSRMRQLGPAGTMAAAGAGGIRMLGAAGRFAAGGIRTLGSAFKMAFGPVSLLIMGLSYGVDYVIGNWEKIGPYFTKLWDSVKSIFSSALEWLKEKLAFLAEIGSVIANPIKAGISKIKKLAGKLLGGQEEEKAPTAQSASPQPAANAAPKTVGETLPKRPATEPVAQKVAPKPATQAAIPTTAQARQAATPDTRQPKQAESAKLEQTAQPAAPASRPATKRQQTAPSQQPQIIQPQVQVSVNITQNGIPEQSFASGVMNAIKARQAELEQIISGIVNEQARLAYG